MKSDLTVISWYQARGPEQITDQRSQVTGHINSLRGWWRGQKLQSNLAPTFLPLTAPSKSTWCYRKSKSWPIFWLAPFFLCAAEKHKCFQPCFKKSLNILHSTHICIQFLARNRFWRYSSNICWQYSHQMSLIDMFYSKNDNFSDIILLEFEIKTNKPLFHEINFILISITSSILDSKQLNNQRKTCVLILGLGTVIVTVNRTCCFIGQLFLSVSQVIVKSLRSLTCQANSPKYGCNWRLILSLINLLAVVAIDCLVLRMLVKIFFLLSINFEKYPCRSKILPIHSYVVFLKICSATTSTYIQLEKPFSYQNVSDSSAFSNI